MKKLLIALSFLLLSCSHKYVKMNGDFCNTAQQLFEQKLIDTRSYMLEHSEDMNDITFENQLLKCSGSKAYAGFTMVVHMKSGICALLNTIVSYTDSPDEIVYKCLEVKNVGSVPCEEDASFKRT